jgi:hypothetical protein
MFHASPGEAMPCCGAWFDLTQTKEKSIRQHCIEMSKIVPDRGGRR